MTVELRPGRWQTALAHVEKVGSVITDPPYGARTHEGDVAKLGLNDEERGGDGAVRTEIDYACWTPDDVHEFVRSWAPRTERWIVPMTSHDLLPAWEAAYREAKFYAFAPIAIVLTGAGVRALADGPANWTIHLPVARRRSRSLGSKSGSIWRSLPGGYPGPAGIYQAGGRGKPQWLADALVGDYSDPGHVVCDPFAAWCSTLVAARNAGRMAIGSESDPVAHAAGLAYLSGNMAEFKRLIGATKTEARAAKRAKKPQLDLLTGGHDAG